LDHLLKEIIKLKGGADRRNESAVIPDLTAGFLPPPQTGTIWLPAPALRRLPSVNKPDSGNLLVSYYQKIHRAANCGWPIPALSLAEAKER
jgi:hypothetical protein